MSSIARNPRALGPGIGDRPSARGLGGSPRAPVASESVDETGRLEGVAEFLRLLGATVALYAFLVVLPFLALVPIVMMGLLLGSIATLLG